MGRRRKVVAGRTPLEWQYSANVGEEAELWQKFRKNVRFGGWSESQAEGLADFARQAFAAPDISGLREFAS